VADQQMSVEDSVLHVASKASSLRSVFVRFSSSLFELSWFPGNYLSQPATPFLMRVSVLSPSLPT